MVNLSDTLLHYKRKDVQRNIVEAAKDREVGVRFDGGFGKRPDVLKYPTDVLEFAKNGATSFHISEERWKDPLKIKTDMSRKEARDLKKGWDLVLDVDFEVWEITKVISDLLVKALKRHGIKSVTCKFSGNKGFHIGVPFEAFPEKVTVKGESTKTKNLFPDSVQRIASYLMHYIDNKYNDFRLSRSIIDNTSFLKYLKEENMTLEDVSIKICGNKSCSDYGKRIPDKKRTNKAEFICPKCNKHIKKDLKFMKCPHCGILMKKIARGSNERICPSCRKKEFIDQIDLKIDTMLISSRHMFRSPYSLHEKSGLVSIPINPDKILEFKKIFAKPKNIILDKYYFLKREGAKKGEAKKLIRQAFDFNPEIKEEKEEKDISYEEIKDAVPESMFPPCIKEGFKGLKDGRKRFLFTIVNFLRKVGWSYDQIENYLKKWNKNNDTPLREVLIKGQVRYHKSQRKNMLPPNCSNKMYYRDIGICKPDSLCEKIKNPVSYARIKAKGRKKKKRKKKKQ